MTVLVQCVICDETWEVQLRVDVSGDRDRWETIGAKVTAQGGCPECGCTEATPI